jgi:hypothetical protein
MDGATDRLKIAAANRRGSAEKPAPQKVQQGLIAVVRVDVAVSVADENVIQPLDFLHRQAPNVNMRSEGLRLPLRAVDIVPLGMHRLQRVRV